MRHRFSRTKTAVRFVAKHPVTKQNIEVIRRSEEKLAEKIDAMVQEAIDTVEVIEVTP